MSFDFRNLRKIKSTLTIVQIVNDLFVLLGQMYDT